MSVEILPFELNFQRPFTVEVSRTLTIRNTGSSPVAFKVKTTAPKQYCVRPNAGRVEPGQDFDVSVLLQAMKAEPPADAKCRDKFLVQSTAITPDKEFESIPGVLDSAEKGQVQERKIRVNWQAAGPSNEAPAPAAVATPSKLSQSAEITDTPEASRTFSSPSANLESKSTGSASAPEPVDDDDNVSEANKSTVSQAATAVSKVAQLTYDELKVKLSQAEAQIATLKDSGLRQRNVKSADEAPKPAPPLAQAVRQSASGVPVHIVAALCLLSFLLAYFFF